MPARCHTVGIGWGMSVDLEERRARQRENSRRHRSRAITDRYVLKGYGLTPAAYDALFVAQGGLCAICRSADTGHKRAKRMFVDHCHTTGVVRGLLCNYCNIMLGAAKDSHERLRCAASYLERSTTILAGTGGVECQRS